MSAFADTGHMVKTHCENFQRFAVRVNGSHLHSLERIAAKMAYSPDIALTRLIKDYFENYMTKQMMQVKYTCTKRNRAARWRGLYLSRHQVDVFSAMAKLCGGRDAVSLTFNQIAVEAHGLKASAVSVVIPTLIERGMMGRVFIKKVEAADGRNIVDLYVYTLYADPCDVVRI